MLLIAADCGLRSVMLGLIDPLPGVQLTMTYSPAEARILSYAHRYHLVIATNFGIPPSVSLDVIPVERSYEAMFISGHWDDDIIRKCKARGVHTVRVPASGETLRTEIENAIAAARRAAS